MATTASAIISPAPGPVIPDAQHPVCLRVDDHFRHTLGAADGLGTTARRPRETRGRHLLRFAAFASVSVRPVQAICGSVNTTQGIALGEKVVSSPAIASTATRPS